MAAFSTSWQFSIFILKNFTLLLHSRKMEEFVCKNRSKHIFFIFVCIINWYWMLATLLFVSKYLNVFKYTSFAIKHDTCYHGNSRGHKHNSLYTSMIFVSLIVSVNRRDQTTRCGWLLYYFDSRRSKLWCLTSTLSLSSIDNPTARFKSCDNRFFLHSELS